MTRLALLLCLSFGISVARAAPKTRAALAGPLLVAEADRQLFDVFSSTDESPPPNTLSTKFRLARDAYLRACKSGVARGCWTSMWMSAGIEESHTFETRQLLVMCRRGTLMACRALQRPAGGGSVLIRRDPGYEGATTRCLLGKSQCDQQRLRAECARGFALSCRYSKDDQLNERGVRLAREGCIQGLFGECGENDPAEALRKCTLVPLMCLRMLPKVLLESSRREMAERGCKIAGRPVCIALAATYALGGFPQSVPGRARYLAKRFCTPAQIADRKDTCYELEGLGAELARLP